MMLQTTTFKGTKKCLQNNKEQEKELYYNNNKYIKTAFYIDMDRKRLNGNTRKY